jgi:hypothetical protein
MHQEQQANSGNKDAQVGKEYAKKTNRGKQCDNITAQFTRKYCLVQLNLKSQFGSMSSSVESFVSVC